MNERIRELASEVGISVEYLTNTKQIELIEKFAELIVKECLNELCEQMDKHNVDLSNLPSWYKVLAKTEEHFGLNDERTNSNTC